MMKRLLIAALASVVIPGAPASAQSGDSVPDVASLRAPATPAFVLLGVSPTDVSRPQTPSDLALSLANSSGGLAQLPDNLAIEITPYWLRGNRTLTWRSDSTRSILQSLERTFAVSLATAETGSDLTPSTGLGLGARAMLVSGRLSPATMRTISEIESSLREQGSIFNRYRLAETRQLDALQAAELGPCLGITDPNARATCARSVTDKYQPMRDAVTARVRADPEYQREVKEAEKAIDDFSFVRDGWFWEVAAGAVWDFANGAWANRERQRLGAWTTLSREEGSIGGGTTWTPILVARYFAEDTAGALTTFDLGGRVVVSSANYALSAELVRRRWNGDGAPDPADRVSGMIEYKLREDTWLFGAIGKDYEEAVQDSFITRFGLAFSLKQARYTSSP